MLLVNDNMVTVRFSIAHIRLLSFIYIETTEFFRAILSLLIERLGFVEGRVIFWEFKSLGFEGKLGELC